MKAFTVIGINRIEFKNKKTKEKQAAIILYTTYDFPERDSEADGHGCETFFCTGDLISDAENISLGDTIQPSYTKTGYLTSLAII